MQELMIQDSSTSEDIVPKKSCNPFASTNETPKQRYRRFLGIFCLLGVVILWVGSSILMQYIFISSDFNKPLFTTYLDTSMFTLYLIVGIVKMRVARARGTIAYRRAESTLNASLLNNAETPDESKEEVHEKLTFKQTAKISLIFCLIWFVDNYTFNLSLTMTSVSSNTILSSTSALWTLILGTIVGVERFNVLRLIGVILTLGGVAIVSLSDTRNDGEETLWGDILSLVSAMTYAVYVILYKKLVKHEDRVDNFLFLGLMGFFNMILLWPLIFIVDAAKVETFVLPTGMLIVYLLVNSLFGTTLSDYLWLLAVLLLTPVIATVGLSLTIPVAMVSDMIIKQTSFSGLYIMGSVFVAIGFVVVNLHEEVDMQARRFFCSWRR